MLAGFALISASSYSQCDSTASICTTHMTADYISDGQVYRALLLKNETAEFHATFYGGSTYRVAGCSGQQGKDLVFSIYDPEHNLLFTNTDYEGSPYWDFQFDFTVNCTIEAKLDDMGSPSGCAVLLISFRQ